MSRIHTCITQSSTHYTYRVKALLHVLCLRNVRTESAYQDHEHETRQEEHHHERVENGEPVNLVFEEVVIQVAHKTRVEFNVRFNPGH